MKLTVYYGDGFSSEKYYNPYFKVHIKWDVPLLTGYDSVILRNYGWKVRGGSFFSRINLGLVNVILFGKFDAFLIHGYQSFSQWLALFLCKVRGIPVIFRGESIGRVRKSNGARLSRLGITGALDQKRLFDSPVNITAGQFLARTFLTNCDIVMFSCTGNYNYWRFLGIPERKLMKMPCTVDNAYFQDQRKRLLSNVFPIRKGVGIGPEEFVILFVGRFQDRKRPKDLLEAVAKLNDEDITLLFVGDGELRSYLENQSVQLGVKAVFTGFLNQSEIGAYYAIADLFIILSEYDASPKALNEALNFCLPVIVSEGVGTASDLVRDAETGFIVSVGDVETVSAAIKKLKDEPGLVESFRARAANSLDGWDLAANVDALERAITTLKDKSG